MSIQKPQPAPQAPTSAVKPPSAILLGDVGAGKTDSLLTYIDAGLDLFVLVTEPTGVDTLLDAARRRTAAAARTGRPCDYLSKLHYHLVKPGGLRMDTLIDQVKSVAVRDCSELQKIDAGLLRKRDFPQYIEMLQSIADFHCDRTGERFGDVTTWGDTRVFCIDSLTGLSHAVMKQVAGTRPTMTQPEYGVAQNLIQELTTVLCGLNCFFALTAHMEFEYDELAQRSSRMVSTIGRKLAPKIPVLFSECILASRKEGKFFFATDVPGVATKWRAMPQGANLPPTFKPLVDAYNKRKEQANQPTNQPKSAQQSKQTNQN